MVLEFDAPLLKWGNSYAIRITRKQAEELGARPGVPLHAKVEPVGMPKWDFVTLPPTGDGPTDWSIRHDEIIGDLLEEEWKEWQAS